MGLDEASEIEPLKLALPEFELETLGLFDVMI